MKKSIQRKFQNQTFIKIPIILTIAVLMVLAACSGSKKTYINLPGNASKLERYAASEIRKYIYLRTGELAEIRTDSEKTEGFILKIDSLLETEEFKLKTENGNLTISGGSEKAVLYGAYELAEQMGVRFYLHGDVIPDEQIPFVIPQLDIQKKPLFSIRGIQPFHDFPEGPDWWSQADYKAIITQLPKLKMNFLGFHTYPERKDFNGEGHKAEPMVWIGTEDQVNDDGTVKSAYPVLHFNTLDNSWGYLPKKTSDYSFGTSQLFEHDKYGPVYTMETSEWPHTDEENINIFNEFGKLQNDVFSYANSLGVKMCIGTETFLVIPENVKQQLKAKAINPESDEALEMVYRGMFERIKKTHPLNYFWFWTPENWTWSEINPADIKRTENDLNIAMKAAEKANVPFKLATCGWVIGPPPDRASFDRFLPKNMPFSCINRNVGFEEIDEAFVRISDREKWAIPWMEDDPALIVPQLWVGRMRRDAADARAFGCNGLIGIHWRTRELGPNVSALAQAAWDQNGWNPAIDMKVTPENLADYKKIVSGDSLKKRDLATDDFYNDWAKSQFGKNLADRVAQIFTNIDGGPKTAFRAPFLTNLPRPSIWVNGPGGLIPDTTVWEQVEKQFAFLNELEAIQPEVKGSGNIERFIYCLNEFRYLKEISWLNCILGEYNKIAETIKKTGNKQNEMAESKLVPLRKKEMAALSQIHDLLVQRINTKGTLGTLTNWQQHVLPVYFEEQAKELSAMLGRELATDEMPAATSEIAVVNFMSPATTLETGENFTVEILTMNAGSVKGSIQFRKPGEKNFQSISLSNKARGVYTAEIPAGKIDGDFEYFIEVESDIAGKKVFPVTAPAFGNVVIQLNN